MTTLPVWVGDEDVEEDAEQPKVPHHAFDVVIADECHCGYTTADESVWRNTLDHFDAIKIGLTATPAAHTKAYFNDVVHRTSTQALCDWRHLAATGDVPGPQRGSGAEKPSALPQYSRFSLNFLLGTATVSG